MLQPILKEKTSDWVLRGKISDAAPNLNISAKTTAKLVAEYPLQVMAVGEPKGEDGTIESKLIIKGSGGEIYQWRRRHEDAPKAGFMMVDEDGEIAVSEKFDYG